MIRKLALALALLMFLSTVAWSGDFTEVRGLYLRKATWLRAGDYNQYGFALSVGRELEKSCSVYAELIVDSVHWNRNGDDPGVGLTANFRYFPIRPLFLEAGVGIGVRTSSPSRNTLGSNPIGLITGGVGLQIPIDKKLYLITEYKIRHNSSMFGSDVGINNHGPEIAIGWKW